MGKKHKNLESYLEVYKRGANRVGVEDKAEHLRSLFLVVLGCLAVSVGLFSRSNDFLALVGVFYFILFPIVLFETVNKFLKIKIPKIGKMFEWSLKWLFGTPFVFAIYYFRQFIEIETVYLILLVTFAASFLQLFVIIRRLKKALFYGNYIESSGLKKQFAEGFYSFKVYLTSLKTDKSKRNALFLDILFLIGIFSYYQFFFNRWAPDYTQMTDLFNHSTVSNKLNQGDFAWFPSSLTGSIQLKAYTNVFHSLLALATSFFSTEYLFRFQFFFQYILIALFFFLIRDFILKIATNDKVLAYFGAFLVLIPSGANLSLNRFAVAPNQVVFFLIPSLILLIKNKKYKFALTTFFVISIFHFLSTALALAAIVPLLVVQNEKLNKIFKEKKLFTLTNVLLLLLSLFSVLEIFVLKIRFTEIFVKYFSFIGFDESAIISSGSINFYARFFAGSLASTFFIFSVDDKYIWLKIPTAITFALSYIPIPFAHRFGSLALLFFVPLLVLIIDNLDRKVQVKRFTLFIVTYFAVGFMIYGAKNYLCEYYNLRFWGSEEVDVILEVEKDMRYYNIDSEEVFVLTEPMTKMLAQSILSVDGSGTYMKTETRESLYDFLENEKFYCGEGEGNKYNYLAFVYSPRVYNWKINSKYRTSEIDNIWYNTTGSLNSKQAIDEFDTGFFESKIIKKEYIGDSLYVLASCEE